MTRSSLTRPAALLGCVLTALLAGSACSRGEHHQEAAAPGMEAPGVQCHYTVSADVAARPVPPTSGPLPDTPEHVGAALQTNRGDIGLTLDNSQSPCTVNSFVTLARQQYFDNTHCHRLTTADSLSVLQCGDPRGEGTGGPGYVFANEYPTDQYGSTDPVLRRPMDYPRGTLAMANAGPGTNGSQFFLVYRDSQLPPQYTIFGTIDDAGLAVLDQIAAAGVADGGTDGPPAEDVTITSVRVD